MSEDYATEIYIDIKFVKTHPDAKLPNRAHCDDSGYDLFSVSEDVLIPPKGSEKIDVGLKLAYITPGYWFRIEPRSGLGFLHSIQPHLGVIDNGYRGDLAIKLYNFGEWPYEVKKGSKIAQFVPYKTINVIPEFADEVVPSERGESGLGSTGI